MNKPIDFALFISYICKKQSIKTSMTDIKIKT